ncbi:sigma-70 family RNA polymerase sigma factor [Spirosoma endbachense]|uniref:Sigma-70 family RNA polymerase sigma factor n=1 Tax=Spirosoma endbachense TaxID=2666025 RepID=A0A6P1W3S7_9BACT|nr:sigma-70 family RNA polymerase sigma factor [Spirosoma endbachense]
MIPITLEQSLPVDHVLWDAIREGDKASLGELYERYYRLLYRYGTRLISDTDLVEDTIQDVFITIWNNRQKLAIVKNIKAYLFTILRRGIHQKSKKDEFVSDIDTTPNLAYPEGKGNYEDLEYEQWLIEKLATVLKSLPQRQMDVILLRYYENFQTSEIATIMGITEKSVRNTLYKALTHLRTHIQPLDFMLFIFLLLQTLGF